MRQAGRKPSGFTLLELLVVLTIIGLLASVALPQLQNMSESMEISNQREAIKSAIDGLGYQSYVAGKPIILSEAALSKKDTRSALPLQIPAGWQLLISQPILYAINGVCSGGSVSIVDPRHARETFLLKPPQCRLEQIDNPA